jgi:sugar phosphate isomerase/epimerase
VRFAAGSQARREAGAESAVKPRPSSPRLGVCSWSCRADGPEALVAALEAVGVSAVQLHLDPLRTGAWSEAATVDALARAGIEIRSGMMGMEGEDYSTLATIRATGGVRPAATWPANRAAARGNAELARRLGITLVTFHAGFLPHERSDPERAVLLARLGELVDVFAAQGVRVGFETGQESAPTLEAVLQELDRPTLGVNFDPANMLLYGMGDPVAALERLGPRVLQVHVKDATAPRLPGTWGEEVRVGRGQVDWRAFFRVLGARAPGVDCMIEREAGDARVADMRAARELVEQLR